MRTDKNTKRHIGYEILTLIGCIILLCFITRLWPLLLLAILGVIVVALWALCRSLHKPEVIIAPPLLPPPPVPKTETDLRRLAFSILEQRITEALLEEYPDARWVWETANAPKALLSGGKLFILLNHAGGFRRAGVTVQNLQFVRLDFTGFAASDPEPDIHDTEPEAAENEAKSEADAVPVNYELLALDWVEGHFGYLNDQSNEAIAMDEDSFIIPEELLPERESWPAICSELSRHDFPEAKITDAGIAVQAPQYQEQYD